MKSPPLWQIRIDRSVVRVLRKLPRNLRQRLWARIRSLRDEPRPHGSKALRGYDLYRVRVGDWRIIYQVRDRELIVLVVRVGPRSGVYDDL